MQIVIVIPHADDEIISMGGSIPKFLSLGIDVHLVYMFPKKEIDEVVKILQEEYRNGSELTYEVIFRREFDGRANLMEDKDMVTLLDRVFDYFKPDEVYIPCPSHHQDHNYLHRISVAALRNSVDTPSKHFVPNVFMMQPETHWMTNFQPLVFSDISGFIEAKVSLMKSYERDTRKYDVDVDLTVRGIASFYGAEANVKYAEAFQPLRMLKRENTLRT